MGLSIIALTGAKESRLSALSDVTLYAPATETYRIQEYHLPIYHALCAMLEEELF
jgi:D-sedoheptulose 7-phosphate isomerase